MLGLFLAVVRSDIPGVIKAALALAQTYADKARTDADRNLLRRMGQDDVIVAQQQKLAESLGNAAVLRERFRDWSADDVDGVLDDAGDFRD